MIERNGTAAPGRHQVPPLVAVAVSPAYGYGRQVIRGIIRFTQTEEKWRMVLGAEAGWRGFLGMRSLQGMIALPSIGDPEAELERLPWPTVNVSGRFQPQGIPSVCADDVEIGRRAARALLDRGLRHFAFLPDADDPANRNREAGFRAELAPDGFASERLPVDVQRGGDAWRRLQRALTGLARPAGVFCFNDLMGRLASQCAWELGLHVPTDLSLIGVDDDEIMCAAAYPPLSGVPVRGEEIGFGAARCLAAMMRGRRPGFRVRRVQPGEVVERASTDLLAVDDPRLAEAMRILRDEACAGVKVGEVANRIGVPRRWLGRAFREHLRCTPHGFLDRLRMAEARRLLLDTPLTLADIADRCGLGYEANLRRLFLNVEGVSPGAWRAARKDYP